MGTGNVWQRRAVLVCFLLTGATGLAYQVVWLRWLTLIFGATVLGAGCVLAAYMAGLALGNAYWAPRADRCAHPLRLYAWLELGVAASAALSPLILAVVRHGYRAIVADGLSDFHALSLLRLVTAWPAIIGPTFLMGGTMPVLARFYTRSLDRIGHGSGTLYAVNTFGAVLGTVLTGFVALPALGVQGTLSGAVTLNLLAALLAWALSGRQAAVPVSEPPATTPSRPEAVPAALRAVWLGYAASGFAAMVYEVAWTRAFVQVFGNSTYAFTTMLAAFLIGLALGAAVAGWFVDRARQPALVLAWLQFGIGLWAVVCTPLIEWLPDLFLTTFAQSDGAWGAVTRLQFVVCCLLLLPATAGLGAVFPTVSRLSSQALGGPGRSVGVPLVYNTAGTVAGALAGGFCFLPHLGLERSIALAAGLNVLVAVAVLLIWRPGAPAARLAGGFALAGLLLALRLVLLPLDPRVLAAGVYMYPEYFLSLHQANVTTRAAMEHNQVIWHREGYCSSLAVMDVGAGNRTLQANGKTDASTQDLATQRALAHLPLLLKPDARSVLVVGLASGCTTGSVLLHPVERVDCVEIEPAMLTAARFFDAWNYRCLDDGRLRVRLQDARNWMAQTRQRYDVITAEPTNPWIAGVNNLFTREYFRDCAQRLTDDGLMCQWVPAYNLNPAELRAVVAAFAGSFADTTLWAFPRLRTDFFLIGRRRPSALPVAAILDRLRGPVRDDAASAGLDDLWRLAGGLVRNGPAVQQLLAQPYRLNTDDDPHVEFSTPRHLYRREEMAATLALAYAAQASGQASVEVGRDGVTGLLASHGIPLAERAFDAAHLRPHHPEELGSSGSGGDVAHLVLTAGGRPVLQVAPLPRDGWPRRLRELVPATALTADGAVYWR